MRRDVKELFKRLDIESFKYHEFESLALGVDLWPMFEAIMLDERVVDGQQTSDRPGFAVLTEGSTEGQEMPALPVTRSRARTPAVAVARRDPGSDDIFSGYAAAVGNSLQPGDGIRGRSESVRAILGKLAQASG